MTQRQNNHQQRGGIRLTKPQISECKNSLENFSPPFLGIKTASSTLITFQRTKLSTRSITQFCWCNWRTFWSKYAAGKSPRCFCPCTTMSRLTGHLKTRKNWPTFASSVLIMIPILRIYCLFPWVKKIEKSPFFFRRRGHCCRVGLVGRAKF